MKIHEQRKANLKRLIDDRYEGVIKKLSGDVGVSHNTIWRLVADSKHGRNIGEDLARRIEHASGVPPGYLDLTVQGQTDAEVEQMAERISALPKRNKDALMQMLELIETGGA